MTDKKQQEQNCCEWMKIYWLDIVLVFIAIAGVTWLTCPEWMLLLEGSNVSTERNTAIRTLAFSYGAIVAFYGLSLGVRRLKATEKQLEHTGEQLEQTGRQLKTTEAGFFYERFERGTELLSSDSLDRRAIGIRILESIHKMVDPTNKKIIRESLLDFIRREAGEYYLGKPEPKPREERVDIETAIKSWGELVSGESLQLFERRKELKMWKLDLRALNLSWANLQGANLEEAGLQNANLWHAKLQNAQLNGARLKHAQLNVAKLQGAELMGTELQNAELIDADLRRAKLMRAELQEARLGHAWLEGACLKDADLKGAVMNYTDITTADLEYAEHLTPGQLETAIYEKYKPRPTLRYGLEVLKKNAYEWAEEEDEDKENKFYFLFDDGRRINATPWRIEEYLRSKEGKT